MAVCQLLVCPAVYVFLFVSYYCLVMSQLLCGCVSVIGMSWSISVFLLISYYCLVMSQLLCGCVSVIGEYVLLCICLCVLWIALLPSDRRCQDDRVKKEGTTWCRIALDR